MASRRLTEDEIVTLAHLHSVPPNLALAVRQQESSGNNEAVSPKGARGAFQVMPDTFRRYMREGNINDPVDNATAGMLVLADGLRQSKGDPEGALQFYYSGTLLPQGKEGPNSGPRTPTVRRYAQEVLQKMAAIAARRGTPDQEEMPDESGELADMGPYGSGPELGGDEAAMLPEVDPMSDIAGLTRPLDEAVDGEWLANEGDHNYELDQYVRGLVDEELANA